MTKPAWPLLAYAILQWEGYQPARHHRLIAEALERVADGTCRRLMIFMPPRHGKSQLTSEFFPAWWLGSNPDKQIIAASYAQDLADDFGRKVRNLCRSAEHAQLFPGFALSDDSQAISRFHTPQRGVYQSVGVGGAATGRGAHLLLIDDPIKSRADAESEAYRRQLKDWYTAVARTRLMPGGAIVLIQCMTGDTPVLMADGSERPLRDVRPGDRVATFSDGELRTAAVLNHASQGRDDVYEIKTESGKSVKANGRHPFLVKREGGLAWTRVRSLKVGDVMIRVAGSRDPAQESRVVHSMGANGLHTLGVAAIGTKNESARTPWGTTESGVELCAQLMHATSPSAVEDFANLTTPKLAGQVVFDRHMRPSGSGTSAIVIGSTQHSTPRSSSSNAESAPSVDDLLQSRTHALERDSTCVLTTTIEPEKCAGFSVTIATSLLEESEHQNILSLLPNIYDFTDDEIVSIEAAGAEDVFDIEVEETHNFIANGLVASNTRWHEDDLAGWLLRDHQHEGWEVLNLPAVAEPNDLLGRAEGEPLWPEAYPAAELEAIRLAVGSRDWAALYQQRPAPIEGGLVKIAWFGRYNAAPANIIRVIQSWDTAHKAAQVNDPSVCTTWAQTDTGYYLLHVHKARMEYPDLKRMAISLAMQFDPSVVLIEDKASGQSLIQDLRTSTSLPILPVQPEGDKVVRLMSVSPAIESGRVFLPSAAPWLAEYETELATFPNAAHDDQVDSTSQALSWLARGGGGMGAYEYMRELAAETERREREGIDEEEEAASW